MDTRDSITISADTLTIVSYATVIAILLSSLRKRRCSSTTLAFAFMGGLLLVGGLALATNVLVQWWSVPWLQDVVRAICACASVGISCELVRIIPNAVAFRDLDQLALAASELRHSQERFERALAGASSGLWEWCLETNEMWFSPRIKELLGYSNDEFRNEFASWDATLHPDDK
jgi:PAS domain-containing protein